MLLLSILLASANLATVFALPTYGLDVPSASSTVNMTSKRAGPDYFPTPPQPTGFTSSLSISFDHDPTKKAKTLDWVFMYTTEDYGVNCRQRDSFACPIRRDPWSDDDEFDPRPTGVWKLDLNGEACTYKNSGKNFGRLFCGSENFACNADPLSDAIDLGEYKCRGKDNKVGPSSLRFAGIVRRPVIQCPYRTTLFA
ncbi:hypothetical protein NX059_005114 [Plenodomus lindquistii]|nr:hypothetical protein NX059_005114 [Plenodomus lindquistii]